LKGADLHNLDRAHRVPWPVPWRFERALREPEILASRHPFISKWKDRQPTLFLYIAACVRFFGRWIDRQPSLVVLVAVLLIFIPQHSFVRLEIFALLLLMFLELADVLCARAVLGFTDNFRPDFTFDPANLQEDIHPSKTDFMGKFIIGMSAFVAAAVIGFTGIYNGMYFLWGSHAVAGNIRPEWPVVQMLYFSVITMTTIGFGDVYPMHPSVQILAACEAVFGTSVLVFMLFALSNTFIPDGD
jgi:hypothetical protein